LADLFKIFYQIVVAGVVGGIFAFAWQRRGWIFQQNLKRAADKHEGQVALTRETFSLVDKRLYASRTYLDQLISGDQRMIDSERGRYRDVVQEWNEKISGVLILIRVRFSHKFALDFDSYFLPAFVEIDRKLREKRVNQDNPKFDHTECTKSIRWDLKLVNARARDFMADMLFVTDGNLQIIEERPKITISNAPNLGHVYLIKSLFKPRVQS